METRYVSYIVSCQAQHCRSPLVYCFRDVYSMLSKVPASAQCVLSTVLILLRLISNFRQHCFIVKLAIYSFILSV